MKINPGKTYRVKGYPYDRYGYTSDYVDKKKKGSELTPSELRLVEKRHRKITKRVIGSGIAASLLVGAGINVVGTRGEKISEEDGARDVATNAAQIYNSKSLREKFELTFIQKIVDVTAPSTRGGSGLLSLAYPYAADFGQSCLAPTPYNTQPSEITGRSSGTIMPPAAFHMDAQNGDALVTPYGGNADSSLRFSVKNGELVPSVGTMATLAANNCIVVDGVPASTPHYSDGLEMQNALNVSAIIGSLHPSDYKT